MGLGAYGSNEGKCYSLLHQFHLLCLLFHEGLHSRSSEILQSCLGVFSFEEVVAGAHTLKAGKLEIGEHKFGKVLNVFIDCVGSKLILGLDDTFTYVEKGFLYELLITAAAFP